jgi:hypothetical protein
MTLVARVKTHMPCYKRPMRLRDYAPRPAHIQWLLASDPAIRWQVMRDLLHPEHIPLEMETSVGRPSRWNTLRALRVLRWYNNSA